MLTTDVNEVAAVDIERRAVSEKVDLPKITGAVREQTSTIENIPLDSLLIDTDYQRMLDADRVSRIAHNWNPDLVGIVVVNQRANERFYVVDGQHRVAAMNRLEDYPQEVLCQVFRGLTKEEEAQLFSKLDTARANLTTGAAFKARLIGRDADAIAVYEAGLASGFQMDPALGAIPGNLRCWATIEKVYRRRGKDGLQEILTILREAWPTERNAGSSSVITGMELFVAKYGKRIDRKRLLIALRSTTPEVLVARARAMSQSMSSVIGEVVAINILAAYNRNLSSNRLPEWYEAEFEQKRLSARKRYYENVEKAEAIETAAEE